MASSMRDQSVGRGRILTEAARMLEDEGPDGLTTRRIAQRAGASTQLIYTLFGGKNGLVDALYREGFRALIDTLAGVPVTEEPVQDLVALGLAYRESALLRPAFYGLMFGHSVVGYDPPEESRRMAAEAFGVLVAASGRLLAATSGHDEDDDEAHEVALHLWAMVHGMVSLELAGLLPSGRANRARFERHVRAVCAGDLQGAPGGPDTPAEAAVRHTPAEAADAEAPPAPEGSPTAHAAGADQRAPDPAGAPD